MIEDPPRQPSILDLVKQYGSVDAPELTNEVLDAHGFVRVGPGRIVTKSHAEALRNKPPKSVITAPKTRELSKDRPREPKPEAKFVDWDALTKASNTTVESAALARNFTREEVRNVQKIALETDTTGIFLDRRREKFAEEFSEWAIRMLREQDALTKAGSPKAKTSYPILPEHAEKLYEEFHYIVRLHVAAFSKANNDRVANTIFDLQANSEAQIKKRENYVMELMAILIENHQLISAKDGARVLTTYRDSDWVGGWMSGIAIARYFQEKYPPPTVSLLMNPLSKSWRGYIAINSVKNPYSMLDMYANNLLTIFTDDGITKHLTSPETERQLPPKELQKFLNMLTPDRRARLALNAREAPYKLLDAVVKDLFDTLTDENIILYLTSDKAAKQLNADEALKVANALTQRDRVQFALRTRKSLPGLDKVAKNLLETLTDEAIYSYLIDANNPRRLSASQAREVISILDDNMRKRIAVDHINDPQNTLAEVADNLINKLNDASIRSYLEREISLSSPKIDLFLQRFSPALRARVAIQHSQQLPAILKSLVSGKLREKTFANLAVEKI